MVLCGLRTICTKSILTRKKDMMILKFLRNLFKKKQKPKDVLFVGYKGNEIRVTLDETGLPYLIEPPAGIDLNKDDLIEIIRLVGKTLENKYLMGE